MGSKQSILLVDDEEIILNALARELRENNYDVTLARNGEEAVGFIGCRKFELIVTDLSMPGLDGIQVLKEAKRRAPVTGVIILTGYGDMTSAIDALRLGADDYLLKPCEADELIIRIQRCLERQESLRKIQLYENILPVCVYCKSIRDDSGTEPGTGKWLRMEEYLHTKSGVDLSHGICPACYHEHKDD